MHHVARVRIPTIQPRIRPRKFRRISNNPITQQRLPRMDPITLKASNIQDKHLSVPKPTPSKPRTQTNLQGSKP